MSDVRHHVTAATITRHQRVKFNLRSNRLVISYHYHPQPSPPGTTTSKPYKCLSKLLQNTAEPEEVGGRAWESIVLRSGLWHGPLALHEHH
ncbi:hypothetical protein PAXRUDRAFT_20161 [Paxillus rubicundulus Ve08.2h10]|uniref:Uncharacterized protein n=1 Tax=Paxillus rubicundulus Ve08.2h10 TaxID=930991 RepID=A0A0D0BRN5_9AGAM|nr:hypothetical protein PAXRUDRAFT_20161 [Paxillus rubicundulus Ve08.2h10]